MIIKRLTALVLVIFLVCGFGILMVCADTDNLFSNPHFTDMNASGTFPNNWTKGTGISMETVKYHDAAPSLKIEAETVTYPYSRSYPIYNIIEGAEYTVSAWLLTMNAGCAFTFRYLCFDADGNYLYDDTGAAYKQYTGDWIQFTETFRPPRGTTWMYIWLRMAGTGTMYVDDVCMRLTGDSPFIYDFKTDGTFYYTERTEDGVAGATVNTAYYPEFIGKTVHAVLYDPDAPVNPIKEEEIRVPENGAIRFTYPLSLLSVKQKAYKVELSFTPPGEDTILFSHTVYKFDRPKYIDDDGFYRDKNGEIFTPSVIYAASVNEDENLDKIGVNAVQGYPTREYLDALKAQGRKAFVVLYDSVGGAGHPNRVKWRTEQVKEFMNHEAVFGWLVQDEPPVTDEGLAQLETAYRSIREVDPYHPIVLTSNSHYDIIHQYCDVILMDSYPYNNRRFTVGVQERMREAIDASCERPVYALLQAFEAEHNGSFPQPQEIRNMQYQALWAGAKGLGYYRYADSMLDGTYLYETNLWNAMMEFGAKEQEIAFDLFVYEKYEKVKEVETDAYTWGVWKDGDGYLALLRNKKYDAAVSVPIPIEGAHHGWKVIPIGGTPLKAEGGSGEILLEAGAGDVILLRITPTGLSLFERGINEKFVGLSGTTATGSFGVQADGSLFLTTTIEKMNPRIFYTFREEFAPNTGKNYVLRFWYRPAEIGNAPTVFIGKNNPYLDRYATLKGAAFQTEIKEDGWIEYTAYFTMPETDETQSISFMLASFSGTANGQYDHFALTEDREGISFTDDSGAAVTEIRGDMKVRFSMHYIAENIRTEDKNISVYVAVYRESDGKEMVDLKMIKTNAYKSMPIFAENGNVLYYCSARDIEEEIYIPKGEATFSVKIFLWNEKLQNLRSAITPV